MCLYRSPINSHYCFRSITAAAVVVVVGAATAAVDNIMQFRQKHSKTLKVNERERKKSDSETDSGQYLNLAVWFRCFVIDTFNQKWSAHASPNLIEFHHVMKAMKGLWLCFLFVCRSWHFQNRKKNYVSMNRKENERKLVEIGRNQRKKCNNIENTISTDVLKFHSKLMNISSQY